LEKQIGLPVQCSVFRHAMLESAINHLNVLDWR